MRENDAELSRRLVIEVKSNVLARTWVSAFKLSAPKPTFVYVGCWPLAVRCAIHKPMTVAPALAAIRFTILVQCSIKFSSFASCFASPQKITITSYAWL